MTSSFMLIILAAARMQPFSVRRASWFHGVSYSGSRTYVYVAQLFFFASAMFCLVTDVRVLFVHMPSMNTVFV